jgi:uncharacterized oxidoreductase
MMIVDAAFTLLRLRVYSPYTPFYVFFHSAPMVSPFGTDPSPDGGHARLGTNPFAIGIPESYSTTDFPIILDFATSMIALGKARNSANAGQEVGEGLLLDHAGNPTTDPNVMFGAGGSADRGSGALMPMAMHKGFGMGLMCEILAGAVTGGRIIPHDQEDDILINNMCSMIFDPTALSAVGDGNPMLPVEVGRILEYVREAPGDIKIPGEIEMETKEERLMNGIPLDDGTIGELIACSEAAGVPAGEVAALLTPA